MEQLYGRTKNNTTDLFSDPSHRMSQRPLAIKSGEGLGFQDIGSSLNPLKPETKMSKGKFKPTATLSEKTRKAAPRISENESDDELLLSSQNSMGGSQPSPSKRTVKGKKPNASLDAEETICVNGRVLAAHPDYKPSSFRAVKGLRFKKSTPSGDAVTDVSPPPSLPSDSQELFKPISDDVDVRRSRQQPPETSSSRSHRTPSETRVTVHSSTDAARQNPPKPRPRPSVVINSKPPKRHSSPESTPRPAVPKRRGKTPEQSAHAVSRRPVMEPPFPSPLRREPQEFPMSLEAKENISDSASSGDVSSTKMKKASTSCVATSMRGPKPMSLPSPLETKRVSRESTFPNLSPLSSKVKGKARARSPEEHDLPLTNVAGRPGGPKPFPMSSEMLVGIKPRSRSPSTPSSKSVKRVSSDDSGAEQSRTAKKRKDSISRVLDMLDEPMEEDSIDMGHARDPSKLCPYCDEELPSHPTSFLRHLLTMARKKSISDPRPRNRRGLKAPLTIYISVCQRHRFESHQLPIAAKRGWPKTIDFTKVPTRVRKMKEELEAIILDKDNVSDIEDIVTDGRPKGPRSKSVFWKEVMKEVKKQGSRTVVGVKGQYASFEKAQPGYYGEQGSVIIHQTLFDLFPPSTFDASLISPLAPAEFIQRILVPEAAVRLIAQDLRVDIEDATVTLRESAQYGVAMFPDTSESKLKGTGDDDEMGVADQIVMERARARRKELAEEEKVENEMMEEARAAQRALARELRREKALERAQQARKTKVRAGCRVDADEASEASEASATNRGTKQRQWTDTCGDSESDAMSVDSLASRRSSRITRKGTRRGEDKASRWAASHANGTDDHVTHKAGKSKEKSTNSDARVGMEPAALRERKKSPPFGGFASLDSDGEQESTPRPARERTTTSNAPILPLEIARNRPGPGASAPGTHDSWAKNLRTPVPDDLEDSDASHRSQRLERPRIKKGNPRESKWLWSSGSSCASPSKPNNPL